MSDKPYSLVSVIIPTYNRAGLLKEAIESVIAQTYRPIECIVVDDGSIDNTIEIVEQFFSKSTNQFTTKYLRQQKAGAQVARNTGTAAASGTFIQYLDSDDLLYPDKLELQVKYLQQHPECDAVFGDWDNGTLEEHNLNKGFISDNLVRQIFTLVGCIPTFSLLYRKKIVDIIGEWDINIKRCQEIDFQLTGLLKGAVFHYQSLNSGLWRYHKGPRITAEINVKNLLVFYRKWEKKLPPTHFDQETRNQIADWYMYFASLMRKGKNKNIALLVNEAARLNPNLPFYNSRKMKILKLLLGKKITISVWLVAFKRLTY